MILLIFFNILRYLTYRDNQSFVKEFLFFEKCIITIHNITIILIINI